MGCCVGSTCVQVGGGSPQQVAGVSLLDIYLHGLHVALICTYIIYDIGIGTIIFSKKMHYLWKV